MANRKPRPEVDDGKDARALNRQHRQSKQRDEESFHAISFFELAVEQPDDFLDAPDVIGPIVARTEQV